MSCFAELIVKDLRNRFGKFHSRGVLEGLCHGQHRDRQTMGRGGGGQASFSFCANLSSIAQAVEQAIAFLLFLVVLNPYVSIKTHTKT